MTGKYMKKKPIIGLMSGTSNDGIDASLVFTDGKNITKTKFKSMTPYSKKTKYFLRQVNLDPHIFLKNTKSYNKLKNIITYEHIKVVKKLMQLSKIKPNLVGFHGQTIFHDPINKKSYQLGNPELLSKSLKLNVIYNFRHNDLKFGGEGAPISPIYHKYLLKKLKFESPSIIINIGGISNLTYWDGNQLIAFDTGPGNNLMDFFMQNKFDMEFDDEGNFASKGKIHFDLIDIYIKDKYFNKTPPKSLERTTLFKNNCLNNIFLLNKHDCLATLCALTAKSIEIGMKHLPKRPRNAVIVGGGQKNKFLINLIKKSRISDLIFTGEQIGLDSDFIEAELIAFLAARKIYNFPSTFPSTTGVQQETVLGELIEYKD